MPSALPGNSSSEITVALTKAALRLFRLADLADALGDLTGLGRTSVETMLRAAERDVAARPSAEFSAVDAADRAWVESVLARTYARVAQDPTRSVMAESLIGSEAVVRLAEQAMTVDDRQEVDSASDDVRAYLNALSESIAYLISQWYWSSQEPNRAAMSQAAGETLQTVRAIPDLIEELKEHLDSSLALAMTQLQRSTLVDTSTPTATESLRMVLELDFNLAPLATDAELAERVSAAVIALLEDRLVSVEITLPTLDEDVKAFGDAVLAAKVKRARRNEARHLGLVLSAFFSPQVEVAWDTYLQPIAERVTVVRAIIAGPQSARHKLDVWRTEPPLASAPIWLSPDEVHAVVESARVGEWDNLALGAGWRAADELPRSVIVEKVIPSILSELVRRGVPSERDWPADVLFLPSWHIGQG